MEPKLYYTEQELLANKHIRFLHTETSFMFTQDASNFYWYKKLYLLQKDSPELKEIYVTIDQYIVIREYLSGSVSRYMKEFDAYVFYSVKDYMRCLEEANKNRLF